MSPLRDLWGTPGQIGYIVNDLESAAQKWTDTVGIGPWRIVEPVEAIEALSQKGYNKKDKASVSLVGEPTTEHLAST